ncbi:unnamed protein product [Paramecium sonneborni]|uniref:F-box domain-containing protein n=1 Tax=Paramecium sonneborni TaxID=65129 RepID=A0A8S1RS05_9CILI|nr:unnamed protein product [Paramecium sonneborni]
MNPEQEQNTSQGSWQLQNNNQNMQTEQNYFWRNVPFTEQQISSRNLIQKLILLIQGIPDIFIHKRFLETTCNKFQQNFLDLYNDVLDIEQLQQIIEQEYNQRIKKQESQISATQNLLYEWEDKVNISQLYQIMKIIKSPNRNLYITKDITKETYFDELKENLNSGDQKYLNNNFYILQESLKGQGIFENFKVQPIKVFRKQLNLIKQQEFNEDDTFMYYEIYKILAFPHKQFKQCYKYDVEAQSVHFQLPKNIYIEVKSNDIEQIPLLNDNSIMKQIPSSLFQNNILSFLGIIELFQLRMVCRYFKTIIEKYWHIPSRKEIIQYELAKDLANNNENLKNSQIAAQTLKQKLRASIDIILNLINWNDLHEQIETGQIEIIIYRPLIIMLRLFNKQQKICYHYEIDGQFNITQLAKNIKQQIHDYLNMELIPLGFTQMKQLYQQALQAPEFNFINEIHSELNQSVLLTILLQALYFHGWMTQVITIQNEILKKYNKELQMFDQKQKYNNDFIKQASKYIYKMNDFSSSQKPQEQDQIMTQIGQILQESLRNINFSPNAHPQTDPYGVICQNNDIIKIHLDVYFQIEILTYVCSCQKYYFDDVVDQQLEMQFNQFKSIKNQKKDNSLNQEGKQQQNLEEEKLMQQGENIEPKQNIDYEENQYN